MALNRRLDIFSGEIKSMNDKLTKLRCQVESEEHQQKSKEKQKFFHCAAIKRYFVNQPECTATPIKMYQTEIDIIIKRLNSHISAMDSIVILIVKKLNGKSFIIKNSIENEVTVENVLNENTPSCEEMDIYKEKYSNLLQKIEFVRQTNETISKNVEQQFELFSEAERAIKESKFLSCKQFNLSGYQMYLEIFYQVVKFHLLCKKYSGINEKNDQNLIGYRDLIQFFDEIMIELLKIFKIYQDAFIKYEITLTSDFMWPEVL